ncbi:MAG: hypothetical protein CVT95_03985 [Bacteroidetes bacterium HGW-Bacteroidetes-12]|nr:MAG: hypothetical protein CVT95_03985 [Bacteroidetes bacterium HGW-Bacteroidetes-12]
MEIIFLDEADFKTTQWAGGTTTQLYISPQQATYADLNFDVRISSASVQKSPSTFTSLPNVHRKLMLLEGKIIINHQHKEFEQHLQLNKFDVTTFEGNWQTTSVGTCTDFNLMTTGNTKSDLSSLHLNKNKTYNLIVESEWKTLFLFVLSGNLTLNINNQHYVLKKNNLLILKQYNTFSFPLHATQQSDVIISKISI